LTTGKVKVYFSQMRVFFGIGLPPQIRKQIKGFVDSLKPRLPRMKWVEEENLHITLRFLGEVDEARISSISSAANQAASAFRKFDVVLGELGAFPNPRKARVFWWGLAKGAEDSSALFKALEDNLVNQGFDKEKRRYHPHITLARLRYPAPLPLEGLSSPSGLSFTASSFTFYQSTLTPQGPIYKILEDFKLG
jgi:2'-5' RNA ligase